ncbi:myo-inositol 2-dehydrogenase-like [Diadema antillarum]|uniref:myo-inositol 2-dehydrogenase-like n=1 Tax=Diadema antillarum TaxID=105358 RepID=UPI003A8ACE1C
MESVNHNTATNGSRQKVGVALFGIGRAGLIHARNLVRNPRVELRWIVEENVDLVNGYIEELYLSDTRVATSSGVEAVWNDEKTAAIVVCVPTFLHESLILAGLKAGKAVFCEKPISSSLTQTKQCYLKAKEVGKPLYCALNRRFDPAIRKLRSRVLKGEVGQVQCIKTTSRDAPFPPTQYLKISGGFFHDCAVHDIDLICWIVGERPDTVFAQGHAFHDCIREMDDVDQANITLKFPSGIMATIDINREAVYGYDQRLEVLGSKGMLQTVNQVDSPVTLHNEKGENMDAIQPSFPERYSRSYVLEMEHFLDLVEGKTKEIEVTMEDTLCTSWIADLCESSMHEGKLMKFTEPVC